MATTVTCESCCPLFFHSPDPCGVCLSSCIHSGSFGFPFNCSTFDLCRYGINSMWFYSRRLFGRHSFRLGIHRNRNRRQKLWKRKIKMTRPQHRAYRFDGPCNGLKKDGVCVDDNDGEMGLCYLCGISFFVRYLVKRSACILLP